MLPLGLVSVEICLWGRQVFLPKVNHQGLLPLCEQVTEGLGVGREWPQPPGKRTPSMPVQPRTLNPNRSKLTGSPCHLESSVPTSHAPGPEHLLFREGRWEGDAGEDRPGPPQGETGGAVIQSRGGVQSWPCPPGVTVILQNRGPQPLGSNA